MRQFTNELIPWSRVFFEKLRGSQRIKKLSAFYGTRRFITAFTKAHHTYLYEISIPIQNLCAVTVEKFHLFVLALFLFERRRYYLLLFHSEVINAIETSSVYRAEQFSKEIITLVINIFL